MHQFFLDESGLPRLDKIEPSSPYFILGGVIVDESAYSKITDLIISFQKKYFPEQSKNKSFRLHASYLVNSRSDFVGIERIKADEIATEFYNLIKSQDDLTLIGTAIHKQKLVEKYKDQAQDPYPLSFLYCCDRFDLFLRENKFEEGKIILESRGHGLDKAYNDRLIVNMMMGTKYRRIVSKIKPPVFESPFEKIPLQIADFVCYAIHKKFNKGENKFFDLIRERFRTGFNKKIEGYGMVEFPK